METVVLLMLLGLRIVGAVVCSKKAKELNRDRGGWAIFGFIAPIIAMIWIYCLKPIIFWDKNIPLDNQKVDKSQQ